MAGLSTYLQDALLNHVFRGSTINSAYTPPFSVYVALNTGDPDTEEDTEVSGGFYQRAVVSFGEPVSSTITNSNTIPFTLPAATVSHISLWDSLTGGNMLASDALETPQIFNSNDTIALVPGALIITLD